MLQLIDFIMQDMRQVLDYVLWSAGFTFLICGLWFLVNRMWKRSLPATEQAVSIILLIFYIILILKISIFSREMGSRIGVSLLPGETWTTDWQGRAYVIENALLYIPLGLLGMQVLHSVKKRGMLVVLFGFGLSVIVEVTQLFTHMGYFQVDDLIMNTGGTLISVLLIVFWDKFKKLWKSLMER